MENKRIKKYIYYTNDKINLRVLEDTPCPKGFHRGRIKRQLTAEEQQAAIEKQKKTCLAKYGVEHVFQAKSVKDKIKQTCISKYGVEYASQAEVTKQHIIETSLVRYNLASPVQTEQCKQKRAKTMLQKYGNENPFSFGSENFKNRMLELYGVSNARSLNTTIEIFNLKIDEIVSKRISSQKRNHTFSTSSPEESYYLTLCEIYGKEDIERQYSIDSRYPFACDFYIKSIDTFIELNLHWTHGGHPFDSTNINDLNKLAEWQRKAKSSDFYKKAIEVWTNRDVKKLQTATLNNLNYKIFYLQSELNN